ncbi:competence protein ComK [Solibacillus sp. FSL K6-1781]|uniref:competence protein ComK n=1 Tax=Solibacillus sp. FSL K6-1781 TaxID=2921474 RepID=UPI00315AB933
MYRISLYDACVLKPKFNQFNNLYTLMITPNGHKRVPLTPLQLLDSELKEHGSSLKGAKEAAKAVLSSNSINPIMIPRSPLVHIWFPTEAMRNFEDCMYFALHHVHDIEPYLENHSIVVLTHNERIKVPVSHSRMNKQWTKAKCYYATALLKQFYSRHQYSNAEQQIMLKCAEINEQYVIN